jgi:DNA repair protein RadC
VSGIRIKDQLASDRPREKLAAKGSSALGNGELIAILLRTGLKGMNAVEVGNYLICTYGNSLQALARASVAA